ncbi:MAG: hypothetical protein AAGA93_01635 [Actinomycetota bacterium]
MSTTLPPDRTPTGPTDESVIDAADDRAHFSGAGNAKREHSADSDHSEHRDHGEHGVSGDHSRHRVGDDCRVGGARGDRRMLLGHQLALALVLATVLPIVGTDAVWSADEGALLYQATAVADGRGWTFPHPFPEVDPDGGWFPIHLSVFATDGGYVVLGKHTVLVRLVGAVNGIGGYPAVLGLSILSGLVAASAAARLAGRLERRAAVPALWLTGVASPLFLSSYVAWAHTLAAALVGWALVGLTTERSGGRSGPPIGGWLAGGLALGLAMLFRTEAVLAGLALTLALAWPAVRPLRRSRWRSTVGGLAPSAIAAVSTAVGTAVDTVTAIDRLGPVRPPGDRWGGLAGRIEAFGHTWLRPDFSSEPHHLLLLGSAAAVIAAGIVARRRPADDPLVLSLLAGGVGALALRFVASPTALIPGLIVAFPVLFTGLALVRRSDLRRGRAETLALFTVLFWGAVLATQYRHGGGGEWGGRYFAIGLPAVIPLSTLGLLRAADSVAGPSRRRVLGLVAIVALLPVTMGLLGMAEARERTRAIIDRVDVSLVDPGPDALGEEPDRPVVLTTLAPLGRWAWEDVDRSRWLLVTDDDVAEAGARLNDAGVEQLVLVSESADDDLGQLAPWYAPIGPLPEAGTPGAGLDRIVIPVRSSP